MSGNLKENASAMKTKTLMVQDEFGKIISVEITE